MKKTYLKKIVLLSMVFVLSMLPIMSYAALPNDEFETQEVSTTSVSFTETNSTTGTFRVSATSLLVPSYFRVTVTLQSSAIGANSYSNVSGVSPVTKTVYNTRTIALVDTFPITSTKDYRIKVVFADDCSGYDYTITKYADLQ